MYCVFVREPAGLRYAHWLVEGLKTVETRSRDMLRQLVGQRVAIAWTRSGKAPLVVGYVTITEKTFCPSADFCKFYPLHLVPAGSGYDTGSKGKYFYHVSDPVACEPFQLPANAIRHGRSWCEF